MVRWGAADRQAAACMAEALDSGGLDHDALGTFPPVSAAPLLLNGIRWFLPPASDRNVCISARAKIHIKRVKKLLSSRPKSCYQTGWLWGPFSDRGAANRSNGNFRKAAAHA